MKVTIRFKNDLTEILIHCQHKAIKKPSKYRNGAHRTDSWKQFKKD